MQLSPLFKRSHWQLCSQVIIWDLHGLEWRFNYQHRGNCTSVCTIILTFDITITGSMYQKVFHLSIMWQLSSSWLDQKKVKLWLIEFPTAHQLMSLSLSRNVHSALLSKKISFQYILVCFGQYFTRVFNFPKAQWTQCLTQIMFTLQFHHHHKISPVFGTGRFKRNSICKQNWQSANFYHHQLWKIIFNVSCTRGAFFAWRAPILSWPRIMCSQVCILKFLEPSREIP